VAHDRHIPVVNEASFEANWPWGWTSPRDANLLERVSSKPWNRSRDEQQG
jgi:hypothetical protein